MDLICFAHRKEASTFEQQGIPHFILGEGIIPSLERLCEHLSTNNYNRIINYGVCGVLQEHIQLKKLYSVRTSIAQWGSNFFGSTYESSGNLDCVTAMNRVNSLNERNFITLIQTLHAFPLLGFFSFV